MQKVMAFGTFDIIHPGHEFYLKQAKKYGKLTVVVARDLTVKKVKGKFPKFTESRRIEDVKKLKIADEVILGNIEDPYKVIEENSPDILCLGYDQSTFTEGLKAELKNRKLLIEVIRIRPLRPELYKSSKLRK